MKNSRTVTVDINNRKMIDEPVTRKDHADDGHKGSNQKPETKNQ